MSASLRIVMLAVACATSVGACFPDDALNTGDAASDIVTDIRGDSPMMDAPQVDAPGIDATPDVTPDAGADVASDASVATGCAHLPIDPLSAMAVYERLPDATYIAFDGAGHVAVASLRDLSAIGAMDMRTLLYSTLPGNVTALRYLPSGSLVLAMVPTDMDGGTVGGGRPGEGAIYTASGTGMGDPMLRAAVGRPGGLAIDGEGTVWFSDVVQNRVFRMTIRADDAGVQVVPMVLDVMAPTWLAFDQMGRTLYVASTTNGGSLYRVYLSRTVMGDLMPSDAQLVLHDLGGVSGLAVDTCDNVYVSDDAGGRVVRAAAPWDSVRTIVRDVPGVRSLAFGQGGTFGGDTLFFLSTGAVRAVSVGATGVTLPVPTP